MTTIEKNDHNEHNDDYNDRFHGQINDCNNETSSLISAIGTASRPASHPIPANRLALDAQIQAAARYQRRLRQRRRIYYIFLTTALTMTILFILTFVAWIVHFGTADPNQTPDAQILARWARAAGDGGKSASPHAPLAKMTLKRAPTPTEDPNPLFKQSEMESDDEKDQSTGEAVSVPKSKAPKSRVKQQQTKSPTRTRTFNAEKVIDNGLKFHKCLDPSQNYGNRSILSELTVDSPTFTFIEYFLRLNLQSSTAKIIQAYEVSNPQLTLQFEKRSKNVLTVDSWIDVEGLRDDDNKEDTILHRGIQFNASGNGMNFPVGKIFCEDLCKQANGKIVKRLMLCKVAIGRSYNAAEDFARIAAIPDGYDSFVLDEKEATTSKILSEYKVTKKAAPAKSRDSVVESEEALFAKDGDSKSSSFTYVVKDSSQILPTFVVVFEFDPDVEKRSRQKVSCENCERRVATVFCQSDAANLCDQCDAEMHSSKLAARHTRVPLEGNGAQTFSSCRIHPDKIVEFFCPSCSRPVCVHCKMVGHHSTGDAARHKLITIGEAFKSVAESANAIDPILESRKAAIKSQQNSVEERAKQIVSNANGIQMQLDEIYQKAQTDLKALLKKKLNILRGDTRELHREFSEIEQLESFLDYQKNGPNATQFILDWAHHQRLRSELHSFPFFRETIDVMSDIRVHGGIQVHVENAMANGANGFGYSTADVAGADKRFSLGGTPTRPRATPTIDLSSYRVRKATDYVSDIPSGASPTVTLNNSPQYQPNISSSFEQKSPAK